MEEVSSHYDRKSSSATVMPTKGTKKVPGALRIDCKPNNEFYDTGSMKDTDPPPDRSLMASIKIIPSTILHRFKLDSVEKQTDYPNSGSTGKVIRHSYSDPRLSPGSTAVGDDDDEERQGYFGATTKKKRSPRGWVAAVMMIVVGALIAITFVLVGLGKALDGNEPSKQHTTTTVVSTLTSLSTSTAIAIATVTATDTAVATAIAAATDTPE